MNRQGKTFVKQINLFREQIKFRWSVNKQPLVIFLLRAAL